MANHKTITFPDGTHCYSGPNCRKHGKFSTNNKENNKNSFNKKMFLNNEPVPTKQFPYLIHVGTLNFSNKKFDSYEGQGLSVSLNPNEWQKIARLSGQQWLLKKSENNTFLDYHALKPEQHKALQQWGVQKGYVTETQKFVVSWYDDEYDDTMTMICDSKEEAEEEHEDGEVKEIITLTATENFPDTTVKNGDIDVEEKLATIWVTEEATEYDGVWWEEKLDVSRLSAPRGVIVPHKIKAWLNLPLQIKN